MAPILRKHPARGGVYPVEREHLVAKDGKSLMDGLRSLGGRLRGGLRASASGGGMARLSSESVMALILEPGRLHGVSVARSRGSWTRDLAGEWAIAPAAEVPPGETPDPAQVAAPLAASLAEAKAALRSDTVVLGLPTSHLLLRVLRLPRLAADELASAVALQMDKLSPFPGDELSISWEILTEDEEQVTVLAAAAPDRHMQVIDQACAAAGVRVSRVDVALLAWWRMLRDQKLLAASTDRQVLLVSQGGEWDLLVLDRGLPVVARGLGRPVEDADLARELTLSLLQVEMECGAATLHEVLVVADAAAAAPVLGPVRAAVECPVRCVQPPATATAADGLCLRCAEGSAMDLTPAGWRQREMAAGTRRRLVVGLSAAAGLWAALLAALVLGPIVTAQLIRMQKDRRAEIASDYQQVSDMRERVHLVRRYMDRSGSLLESLRTICEAQPEGMELSELTYERERSCKFKGEAAYPALVYTLKERIETNAPFRACRLGSVSLVAGSQRHRFEMEAILGEAPR